MALRSDISSIMGTHSNPPVPDEDREPLNQERIVDSALELLDETGLDAFSTRRLASRLGIRNASLYWHFRNKDEILDAMCRRLYQSLIPTPTQHDAEFDWSSWLADGARAINRAARATRDGARIMVRLHFDDELTRGRINKSIKVLEQHGFSRIEAVYAIQTLRRFALGSALQERIVDEEIKARSEPTHEELFEFGLGMIIESLRQRFRRGEGAA